MRLTKKIYICCHQSCGKKLKISLFRRNYLLFIVAVPALVITIYLFGSGYRSVGEVLFKRFFLIILLLLFLLPPIIWQNKNPIPFEFVLHGDMILFTFQDKEYAKEFASLNDTKIKVKI